MNAIASTMLAYLDHLGVPWTLDKHRAGDPIWSGSKLFTGAFDPNGADHCHEAAHWLVATSEERPQPNFGLGKDWRLGKAPKTVLGNLSREREYDASVLGLEFFRILGGDWITLGDDSGHGWWADDPSESDGEYRERAASMSAKILAFEEWLTRHQA